MTIDLAAPVPHATHTCDHCGRSAELYRLIGTAAALCRACFARSHG